MFIPPIGYFTGIIAVITETESIYSTIEAGSRII
jgi:hypothetical protein